MLIETFTGVTEKANLKASRPIDHLLLVVSGTDYANLLNAKIRCSLYNGLTSVENIPKVEIAAIAALKGRIDGLSVYIAPNNEMHIQLPLAQGGGLDLGGESKYLSIELTGLTATQTIQVWGLESTNALGFPILYKNREMNSEVTKQQFVNNGHFEFIVLPKSGLDRIKCNYNNGGMPEMRPVELLARNLSENELSMLNESTSATSKQAVAIINDFYVLDASEIQEFEIEKTGSSYKFIGVDLANN
jgi:hypothetical protein